nr:glycerophosphodiester phosphodiesterase family protein [Propionicimonas sp.]
MSALSRPTFLGRVVAGCALVLAVSLAAPTSAPGVTVGTDGKPIKNKAGIEFGISAHRGGMGEWPQNSLEAFTETIKRGFDSLETDMVFTRDGHAVMSHEDKLASRCLQDGQTGLAIHSMTLEQVQQVRCANLAGEKVVPIPTFEQLAAALKGHPEILLSLEVKAYTGQSAAGKKQWAEKAIKLVQKYKLQNQTKLISFNWEYALPVFRKYEPKIRVIALDQVQLDLDRVRLAKKLGASAYGTRVKYTSVYLVKYVKSLRIDSAPWSATDNEQRAFQIYHANKSGFMFGTDTPSATQDDLVNGRINLDPVPTMTATTLTSPVTISSITYKTGRKYYKAVPTKAVPTADLAMLGDVTLKITVKGGTGKGSLSVGPASSPSSASVKVALPKGTKTLTVRSPLGDNRKVRISTTKKVKLTVQVVSYQRMRFPSAG